MPRFSPLVSYIIVICRHDVGIAIHTRLARHGTDCRASPFKASSALVARTHGEELVAREISTMKLVDHERFEAVADGIDVLDPYRPF